MNKRRLKKAFKKIVEGQEPTVKELSALLATIPKWMRGTVAVTVAARRVVGSMSAMAAAFGGLSKLKLFHGGEGEN